MTMSVGTMLAKIVEAFLHTVPYAGFPRAINATLVAQRQNEDMKKISGWAAILFAPTLIGAIYGMNFDHMPELHWRYGFVWALGLMVASAAGTWILARLMKWL